MNRSSYAQVQPEASVVQYTLYTEQDEGISIQDNSDCRDSTYLCSYSERLNSRKHRGDVAQLTNGGKAIYK